MITAKPVKYNGKSPISSLSDLEFSTICQKALDGKKLTYSPYSNFPVGCAVLGEDNNVYVGANVENASYGGSICAERCAILKAVTSGNRYLRALAVSTNSKTCSSPCGICRQVIREFSKPELDLPIIMLDCKGKSYILMTIDQLLPLSFGPDDLITT